MNFNNIAAKYEELVLIEEQLLKQAKVCEDMIGHCIQDAVTSGQVALPVGERTLFIGELALDGSIRPVNGVLSMVDLQNGKGSIRCCSLRKMRGRHVRSKFL